MKIMKKLCFLLLVLTAGIAGCSEDDSTDPTDPVMPPSTDITADFAPFFAQELQKRGYIADANKITFGEVKEIIELNVSGKWNEETYEYEGKLTSLKGIEYFESLTCLDCGYNQLTALDVSKNTALRDLLCDHNQLTALDVSKNTKLTELVCDHNQLTELDVTKNTALTYLDCGYNQLTALDVSQNTALTYLNCGDNQLTSLDVSKNTALTSLYCSDNPGDRTVFPVTAWFDNSAIPSGFQTESWGYNGATVTIDYRKVE